MIEFGAITSKTIRVPYTTEVNGYKVSGQVTYNKENKMTDAFGNIRGNNDNGVCSFNTYSSGEDMRVNINDCTPAMMSEVSEVVREVLAALSNTHPVE